MSKEQFGKLRDHFNQLVEEGKIQKAFEGINVAETRTRRALLESIENDIIETLRNILHRKQDMDNLLHHIGDLYALSLHEDSDQAPDHIFLGGFVKEFHDLHDLIRQIISTKNYTPHPLIRQANAALSSMSVEDYNDAFELVHTLDTFSRKARSVHLHPAPKL